MSSATSLSPAPFRNVNQNSSWSIQQQQQPQQYIVMPRVSQSCGSLSINKEGSHRTYDEIPKLVSRIDKRKNFCCCCTLINCHFHIFYSIQLWFSSVVFTMCVQCLHQTMNAFIVFLKIIIKNVISF